jgi:hypothetical protein
MKRRELKTDKPGKIFAALSAVFSDQLRKDTLVHHKRAISSYP